MKCSLKIVKYMLIMGIALNVPLMSYAKSSYSCKEGHHSEKKGCCKGDKGKRGKKGCEGDKGERGKRGRKGDKGDTGPEGPQGEQGNPAIIFIENCYSHNSQTLNTNQSVFFDQCVIPGFPNLPGNQIQIPFNGTVSVICVVRATNEETPAFLEIQKNGQSIPNSQVNAKLEGNSVNALSVTIPVVAGDVIRFASLNEGVILTSDFPASNAACQVIGAPALIE